jgi:hypothetical protein
VLVTRIALAGSSDLVGYSYELVFTVRHIPSEITGTITWPTHWFRPESSTPTALNDTFVVMANLRTTSPAPHDPDPTSMGPQTIETLQPVASGQFIGVDIGEAERKARYRITDRLKNAN